MKRTTKSLALALLPLAAAAAVPPALTDEGFRVPQPGWTPDFPRDHGSHPDFKIEWWYLTGHLTGAEGRDFGFQATFFRFAGPLGGAAAVEAPVFGGSHLFSTQVALSDFENERLLFDERLDRDGWDARAATTGLDLRHGPWRLEMTDLQRETMALDFSVGVRASAALNLRPLKPLTVFGPDGTSRKGPDPAARSYYLTFTRLAVDGEVVVDGETVAVSGTAWMDHEIASRQLSGSLSGWDWTAIQLADGREIKAYLLRREDGRPSEFSRLMWIGRDGSVDYQHHRDHDPAGFDWEKLGEWRSPATGTRYPTTVCIITRDPADGRERRFTLRPKLADQEIVGRLNPVAYWEGACTVSEGGGGGVGEAYLELVGYDGEVAAGLR